MTDNDSVGHVLDKRVCEGKQLGVDAGEKLKDLVREVPAMSPSG